MQSFRRGSRERGGKRRGGGGVGKGGVERAIPPNENPCTALGPRRNIVIMFGT